LKIFVYLRRSESEYYGSLWRNSFEEISKRKVWNSELIKEISHSLIAADKTKKESFLIFQLLVVKNPKNKFILK
jgi:hypothetical protein